MSLSTNLISGLASGFDWRGMIDQLMAIEHQRIDLVEDRKADYESKITILQSLNTKLLSFRTKAAELAISDSFNLFKSSLTTNSSTYSASDFLTVTTNSDASPGAHTIDMDINSTIAMARKISSRSFSSYDEALNLTGEFIINSKAVNIESGDDLFDIQDKINTLNTGTNATGVTASVLTVSSTNYRLILTSDNTGKDSLSILDASADSTDILQNSSSKPGLGFFDGTTPIINNPTSDGAESNRFSSSEVAVGSLLGLTGAQTGTNITVGSSSTLDINLATDSLTTIASNINALSGVSASVESVTEEGTTSYYIDISGTTSFVDQNNVLQTLGILKGGQSDVAKVLVGEVANTEKSSGNPIDGSTTFDDITDYTSDTGDTITISGVKHDGTTVSATTFNIYDGGYKDIDALLDEIESQFGLTAGGAVMDANGKIQITDSSAGDSQLSISLVANNEGWTSGGTLDFGDITASVEGYVMELQAGQDANIIIDGTTITSSSNLIDDVITGVTLNLLTVENPSSGTKTVNLTVSRDLNSVKSSIQDLLDGYNDVITDINAQFTYDEESESAGLLQGDSTLSSIKTSLQNILVNSITGLPTTMNALSLIGIHSEVDLINHENDGMLTIDDDEFMDALEDNFNGVRRLFVAEGTTTDGDVEYINHTNNTVAGEYDINITQAATQTQETGSVVLTNGIGAGDIEVLTITQGGKTAAVTLDGDTGENGSTIDNIVNAINSELNTEYAQKIIGNVKNTTDSGQTTAITSNTVWSAIYSGGVDAGLVTGTEYEITFQGHTRNGKEVSGSYTISDADTDTVQGLLSAIESTYGYEVTASIDTDGYLVVTDNITGNSDLDLTITEPGSLNFGEVVTSNLVGGERLTKNAGADAIIATDSFSDIDNHGLTGGETIYYYGYKSNGVAVEGSYTLQGDLSDTLQNFLSDIAATYGGDVAAGLQDGRIVITNGSTNSSLGIEIIEPGTVDFGIISGGVTGRYGIDITASKDGSDHLVLTSDDYGSNANFVISESRATTNTDYNQIIYTNTANTTKASNGDIYVTSSTTWDDIYGTGTIENGDTITISGTDRNGDALDTGIPEDLIYTIDVTNNMNDLLTRIEDVFLNDTSASTTVEARIEQGKIIIEDQTSGVSQISLTLTYEDVGGSGTGNLDLGAFDQSAERDLDLGLVNITRSGLDVVGTINGEAATGSGQTLVGDAPGTDETTSVEGLTIRYTGPSTGAQGTVKITMGTAELFDRVLYDITNISDGYLDFRLDSMGERVNDLKYDIEDMEARLNLKMEVMINKFVAMELALSKIQNQSQWLTGQINASFSGWAWS